MVGYRTVRQLGKALLTIVVTLAGLAGFAAVGVAIGWALVQIAAWIVGPIIWGSML